MLTVPIFWLASRVSLEPRGNRFGRVLLFLGIGVVTAMFVDVATHFMRDVAVRLSACARAAVRRSRGAPVSCGCGSSTTSRCTSPCSPPGIARDIFARYRARHDETVRLTAEAAQLQAQLAEARLEVLSAQLNPHFLFNTLHAVSSLVERDPRGVRRMIARLSELLRVTLEGTNEQEISLARELELLQLYLDIMQVRFQGRLDRSDQHVDADVMDALVPNFVLQPLVENAVMHGVSKVEGAGPHRAAGATGRETTSSSPFATTAPGSTRRADARRGPSSDRRGSGGVGLSNTRARLQQLYGADQRLSLRRAPKAGTIAEIVLPFHTGADLHAEAAPATA